MRYSVLAAAAATLFVAGCDSSSFMAQNKLLVVPTGPTEFTVPFRGLSGDTDFWCAAGDYAIRGLGVPPATPIYRLSPPPRAGGDGIDFSLSSEGAQDPGLAILSRDLGVSASFARNFCVRLRTRIDD